MAQQADTGIVGGDANDPRIRQQADWIDNRALAGSISRADRSSPTDMAAVNMNTYRLSGEEVQMGPDGKPLLDANGQPIVKNKLDPYAQQALAGASGAQARGPASMGPVKLGAAPTQEATTINPAAQATAERVKGATVANTDQRFGNMQQSLAQRLEEQSQGKGPSLAGATLQQGVNAGLRASLAAAASRRGGNDALAQKRIADQEVEANAAAGQEGAKMRIQEQLNAQQALAGVTGQGRAQDIGKEVTQAELTQGAQTTNAGLGTDVSKFNTGQTNELSVDQARLDAARRAADQETAAKYGLTQGELDLRTGQANLGADVQQRSLNDQYQESLLNQGANVTQQEIGNAQRDVLAQTGQADTLAQIHQGAKNASFGQTLQTIGTIGNTVGAGITTAGLVSDVRSKYALAPVSSPVEGKTDLMPGTDAGFDSVISGINNERPDLDPLSDPVKAAIDPAKYAALGKQFSSLVPQAGYTMPVIQDRLSGLAPVTSDAKTKKNISEAIDDKLEGLAGDINGYSYSYKDPSRPGAAPGRHVSPMAHEFKRNPLTRGMVQKGPDGKDVVDYARGFGTLWALVAHMDDELKEMKAAFGDSSAAKKLRSKKADREETMRTGRAH